MTRSLVQNKEWLLAWGAKLVRALLDVPPNLFGDHEILPGAFLACLFLRIPRLVIELLEIDTAGRTVGL